MNIVEPPLFQDLISCFSGSTKIKSFVQSEIQTHQFRHHLYAILGKGIIHLHHNLSSVGIVISIFHQLSARFSSSYGCEYIKR
jgi:hypothetical protein